MSIAERHPFYVCDGCDVRPPHEHRCYGADQGPVCGCIECSFECDGCGVVSPAGHKPPDGWFFGSPHPSDGIGDCLCPECAPKEVEDSEGEAWWNEDEELAIAMNDYRCLNGHAFAAPNAEHGGPWATLVCPDCGATAMVQYWCEHFDDPTFDGQWCGYCNPEFGGDKGSA